MPNPSPKSTLYPRRKADGSGDELIALPAPALGTSGLIGQTTDAQGNTTPVALMLGSNLVVEDGVLKSRVTRTFNSATRPIDSTPFTVSSTNDHVVRYSVTMQHVVTALLGAAGDLWLERQVGSDWVVLDHTVKNTGPLATTLSEKSSLKVSAHVPAGAVIRLRTAKSNASLTYDVGTETLL